VITSGGSGRRKQLVADIHPRHAEANRRIGHLLDQPGGGPQT
jgi:hypothetical protein